MSGPVAAGATLAMSVLIERTSRGVFRRDLGSHPENEVVFGAHIPPPIPLVARCFLVCGFSLIRECCGSECHMKDRKCILYRSIWLVPCLGHMGTGGGRRDLASVFVSFTIINKLEVRPLLLLAYVSAGVRGLIWDRKSLAPFRNAILTTVSTWFWLPSGLLGVTDPDEGGRVPLPHGARLRHDLYLPTRVDYVHFFIFSLCSLFSRPLPFFTTRQNRAPALYHFSGSNTPWVQGPATDFIPKRSNTPWAHGPATCSVFPIDFALRLPPGTLGTCTPVQHRFRFAIPAKPT